MTETELDRLKKITLNIQESIGVSTFQEKEELLNNLYAKWIVKPGQGNDIFDYLKLSIRNFNLSGENLQMGLFDRAQEVASYEVLYLHSNMLNSENMPEEKRVELGEKFTKIFRAIVDATNAISSSLYLVSSMTLEDIGQEKNTKAEMCRFSEIEYDKITAGQSLLLYLLEQLQRKEYRRYVVDDKGFCYKKIYNQKGQVTHAWQQAMSVKEFVHQMTRKEFNAKMWYNRTLAKDNTTFVVREITEGLNPEFEDLYKDRHMFSFRNGVYIAKNKNEKWEDEGQMMWIDQWIPFEGPGAKKIGASVVSSKYFDLEFENHQYEDWFDIIKNHTPNFKNVMDFQQWPEEVQRWMCILLGRMLYNVGDLDDWQVYIFLYGVAGSGKSLGFGSKVMVYDGSFEEIQNIKVGDKLMGDDSTPRTVLAVSNGWDNLYCVKQENGDDYVVNGDHILSLKSLNDDIVDISVNDYLGLSQEYKKSLKGYKVPLEFPEKEVPFDPYIMGICVAKEYCKYIPDIYKCNSRKNQLKLLTGYLDTNGVDMGIGGYYTIQKNYKLAKDIEYIARSLGFRTNVEKNDHPDGIYYDQYISGNGLEEINERSRSPRGLGGNHLYTEITVEPVEQEFYDKGPEYHQRYSVQIDGNQRFVLGDHTVTHNSTIIENVIKQFYEINDVGIIGNNTQKQFALSSVVNKRIVLGPEIKGNWSLDQAQLQSMVSGESVLVDIKHKTAEAMKFTAPLAIAGNQYPNYEDNSGSMSRRTVTFPYEHKVKKGDSKLGHKIQLELSHIVQACNKGYLDAVYKHGASGIWEVLPPLFKAAQEAMAENMNSLMNFLKSDRVIFGEALYCREKVFIAAFNDHCKDGHFTASKWTTQYYMGPFSEFGIRISKNRRLRYPNIEGASSYGGTFLLGLDLKDAIDIADDIADDDGDKSSIL